MLRRPFGAPYKALSINNIAIFRVIKIPTLKMVNSLLLSDLLVARPVFRFEDINNESNSNQNCELDCELDCELKLTDRQKVILYILMSDGEKTAS